MTQGQLQGSFELIVQPAALLLGADGVLLKPFDQETLLWTIKDILASNEWRNVLSAHDGVVPTPAQARSSGPCPCNQYESSLLPIAFQHRLLTAQADDQVVCHTVPGRGKCSAWENGLGR